MLTSQADGLNLWINGVLVSSSAQCSSCSNGAGKWVSGSLALAAGTNYSVKLELTNPPYTGYSQAYLYWQTPTLAKAIIPKAQLFPAPGTGGPSITSAVSATAYQGQAFNYQITATNNPSSFTAVGLPSGLSLNALTGLISGTPATLSVSSVTINAYNSLGKGSAVLSLSVIAVPPAPVITSALSASGLLGSPFSYQITATNGPTSYNAAALPAGLSVNAGTGQITGTPSATGTSSVVISATNAGGTGSATLTLAVTKPAAPAITSALAVAATVGAPFSYQITASNGPTSFGAVGLPAGLSLDAASGIISGTPGAAAAANVAISATNAGGTGSAALILTVSNPSLTSGLLAWWKYDESSGATALDSSGMSDTGTLTGGYARTAGVLGGAVSFDGTSGFMYPAASLAAPNVFSYAVWFKTTTTAGGKLIGFGDTQTAMSAANDRNLYMNNAGQIYFGVFPGGVQTVNTTASYNDGKWHQVAATLASDGMKLYVDGVLASSNPAVTSGWNYTGWWKVGGDGLGGWTSQPTSDFFGGALDDTRIYNRELGASEVAALFGSTGAVAAPAITSALFASSTAGKAFSYQIAASNSPTSFGATGLPAGLSINTTSGLISGTPGAAGTSSVAINASNAGGTGSATLTLTVNAVSPSGATIPPASQIVDASGGVWTVSSSSVVYLNGVTAGYSTNVVLLYYNGVIYQENNAAGWRSWNGSGWTGVTGDPRPSAPSITITSPVNGASVSGTVAVTGTAADNVSVSSVGVSIDGGAYTLAAGTSAWTFSLNTASLSAGPHSVTAMATDSSGNTATSSITISVADTTPPTAAITAPASGATLSGAVAVKVSASDNVGVAKVEMDVDGKAVITGTAAPYNFSWDTKQVPNGSHTLAAKAFDAAGNVGTASITVNAKNKRIRTQLVLAPAGFSPAAAGGNQWGAPTAAIFSVSVDTAGEPTFPLTPTLQAGVTLPSGYQNLTLARLPSNPAVYYVQLPSSTFAPADYASLNGSSVTITVGAASFDALGQTNDIQPSLGGVIQESSGAAQVVVLPGGVTQEAQLAINPVSPDVTGQRAAALAKQNLKALDAGREIVMSSSGTLNSATLTLSFDPSLLPPNTDLHRVVVAYFNPSTAGWEVQANSAVNGSLVQTQVTHFSLYAPVLITPSSVPGLRDSYVYPNPAVGNQDPVIRASLGLVDSVDVTIFDVSGRKVYSGSMSGAAPTGISGGQYYYDYVWPGSKPSGAYYAVIHGHAHDGSLVKARAKFIVVR